MTARLVRERLYRLGAGPVPAQYFPLPRTAIVDVPGLRRRAVSWDRPLADAIETLAREHGAPSTGAVDVFMAEARRLDAGHPDAAARSRFLGRWVDACTKRDPAGRALELTERAVCFAVRRVRPGNDVPLRDEAVSFWVDAFSAEFRNRATGAARRLRRPR